MYAANRAPDRDPLFSSISHHHRSATVLAAANLIEHAMNLNLSLTPLISLLAGILILAMPRLLNYIVAIYLIVVGLIGLFGVSGMRLS